MKAHPPTYASFTDPNEYQRVLERLYPFVNDNSVIDSLADGTVRHKDYIGVVSSTCT